VDAAAKRCLLRAIRDLVIHALDRAVFEFDGQRPARVAGFEIAADHVLEPALRIIAELDLDMRFAARFDFGRAGIADADVAEPIRDARDVNDDILQRLRAEILDDNEEAVEGPLDAAGRTRRCPRR
jgi:hypothetical protein